MSVIKYEYELYEPVKNFFENMGYTVNGEVKGCDITAVKDDTLITIELKKGFSLKFFYQLADRVDFSDMVYAVVPLPSKYKNIKQAIKLLKALGVGLITVSQTKARTVSVLLEPVKKEKIKSCKRARVMKEIESRKTSLNKGGVTGTMIITAFREKSVFALCIIDSLGGTAKTSDITRIAGENLTRLLYKNNLGWFSRKNKGEYSLTEKGREIFNDEKYNELIKFYRKEVNKNV